MEVQEILRLRDYLSKHRGKKIYVYMDTEVSTELIPGKTLLAVIEPQSGVDLPCQIFDPKLYAKVESGWYHYSDGSFSPEIIPVLKVDGVVAAAPEKESCGLIIGLNQETLIWSDRAEATGITGKQNGEQNTQRLNALIRQRRGMYSASNWCLEQKIGKEAMFLPALNEWMRAAKNFYIIQNSLSKIKAPLLQEKLYWTSTEFDEGRATVVLPNSRQSCGKKKDQPLLVRAFKQF